MRARRGVMGSASRSRYLSTRRPAREAQPRVQAPLVQQVDGQQGAAPWCGSGAPPSRAEALLLHAQLPLALQAHGEAVAPRTGTAAARPRRRASRRGPRRCLGRRLVAVVARTSSSRGSGSGRRRRAAKVDAARSGGARSAPRRSRGCPAPGCPWRRPRCRRAAVGMSFARAVEASHEREVAQARAQRAADGPLAVEPLHAGAERQQRCISAPVARHARARTAARSVPRRSPTPRRRAAARCPAPPPRPSPPRAVPAPATRAAPR